MGTLKRFDVAFRFLGLCLLFRAARLALIGMLLRSRGLSTRALWRGGVAHRSRALATHASSAPASLRDYDGTRIPTSARSSNLILRPLYSLRDRWWPCRMRSSNSSGTNGCTDAPPHSTSRHHRRNELQSFSGRCRKRNSCARGGCTRRCCRSCCRWVLTKFRLGSRIIYLC